jgi:hypothetical protein
MDPSADCSTATPLLSLLPPHGGSSRQANPTVCRSVGRPGATPGRAGRRGYWHHVAGARAWARPCREGQSLPSWLPHTMGAGARGRQRVGWWAWGGGCLLLLLLLLLLLGLGGGA